VLGFSWICCHDLLPEQSSVDDTGLGSRRQPGAFFFLKHKALKENARRKALWKRPQLWKSIKVPQRLLLNDSPQLFWKSLRKTAPALPPLPTSPDAGPSSLQKAIINGACQTQNSRRYSRFGSEPRPARRSRDQLKQAEWKAATAKASRLPGARGVSSSEADARQG